MVSKKESIANDDDVRHNDDYDLLVAKAKEYFFKNKDKKESLPSSIESKWDDTPFIKDDGTPFTEEDVRRNNEILYGSGDKAPKK